MPSVAGAERESRGLWARLRAHPGRKLAVLLGLSVGICVPYFGLQRLHAFPLRTLPATAIDRAIAFDPAWIWAYLSIAVLVPIAPLLAVRGDDLLRYAKGLALLCLPCFAAYVLFPVDGPRPHAAPLDGAYALIISVDRAANSLPSLHAGLAVYSLLFGYRVAHGALGRRGRVALALGGSAWGALILYSTLATKQHWALDLPLGVLLAWSAHARVWRAAVRSEGREELPLTVS
jgi:hypothetical protein